MNTGIEGEIVGVVGGEFKLFFLRFMGVLTHYLLVFLSA